LPVQAAYYSFAAQATSIENMAKIDRPLRSEEARVWKAMARLLAAASRLLDEDLQRGANISLSEYAVLVHLSEASAGHLRVSELADLSDLSDSRITRIVGDLARDGFVVKSRSQRDGRGIDVRITDAGLNRLGDAYPIHLASVRDRIMNRVDPKDLSRFGDVLAAVVGGIHEPPHDH
jgi:DNA-binding MarR family transcriptional regulator